MPPSPSERALKTRLFPPGLVKRVRGLTLSARNTYTGHQRFRRKLRAATEVWDEPRHPGHSARSVTVPEGRVIGRSPYFSSCCTRWEYMAHEPYPKCDRNSNAGSNPLETSVARLLLDGFR